MIGMIGTASPHEDVRPEHFFIRRLRDIEEWLTPPTDDYKVLQLGGHLRQMLLDGHASLLDLANADHRLKFTFRILDFENDPFNRVALGLFPDTFFEMDSLYPGVALTRSPVYKLCNRDGFLKSTVGVVRGAKVTVKDAILHTANKLGAVHLDHPAAAQEALLGRLAGSRVFGMDSGIRIVMPIAQIFLAGVQPLREAIEAANS